MPRVWWGEREVQRVSAHRRRPVAEEVGKVGVNSLLADGRLVTAERGRRRGAGGESRALLGRHREHPVDEGGDAVVCHRVAEPVEQALKEPLHPFARRGRAGVGGERAEEVGVALDALDVKDVERAEGGAEVGEAEPARRHGREPALPVQRLGRVDGGELVRVDAEEELEEEGDVRCGHADLERLRREVVPPDARLLQVGADQHWTGRLVQPHLGVQRETHRPPVKPDGPARGERLRAARLQADAVDGVQVAHRHVEHHELDGVGDGVKLERHLHRDALHVDQWRAGDGECVPQQPAHRREAVLPVLDEPVHRGERLYDQELRARGAER